MLQSTVANYLSPEDDPVNLLAARMNPNIAAQGAKARANMAPPTSIMDPRYPAWKKSQDDAELLMLMSDIALSAIPLAGPAARGAMATGRALAPTAGRMTENYLARSGGILPMDTWHGTPHLFPPTAKNPLGEFDASKIGTGEGAQAYGHGLYLAENPGVAKEYARKLATFDEELFGPIMQKYNIPGDIAPNMNNVDFAKSLLADYGNKLNAAEKKILQDSVKSSLYKVDLPDEQIAKMLDWDKPLSQQAPEVQAAFDAALKNNRNAFGALSGHVKFRDERITGADLYNGLRSDLVSGGVDATRASNKLRELGIPGIRYLDQGSRGAPSSAMFTKSDVVGAADDLTEFAKSLGLDAKVQHSGSNAGKSSYVSVFDPTTNRYIKSSFRISDHGTGPLRHQEHIHVSSPADLAAQKNDLFEWVKRNRTEKGVDTTGLSAPSQGTSNFVVFDPAHMNIIGRE